MCSFFLGLSGVKLFVLSLDLLEQRHVFLEICVLHKFDHHLGLLGLIHISFVEGDSLSSD